MRGDRFIKLRTSCALERWVLWKLKTERERERERERISFINTKNFIKKFDICWCRDRLSVFGKNIMLTVTSDEN